MKIVKLTDSQFYFESDCDYRVVDWAQLLTILSDIEEHLGDTDMVELISELAMYKNGSTRVL